MFARRLAVIVYFAVGLIPVLLLGIDGPWLSGGDAEIRVKTPFPKKLSPGSFRDFDEWFADHVGLRYPLIYAGSELHVGLLRRPLDRHIFFGRNGWMFWTDDGESSPATGGGFWGRRRKKRAGEEGGCGGPVAFFESRVRPRRCEHPRGA